MNTLPTTGHLWYTKVVQNLAYHPLHQEPVLKAGVSMATGWALAGLARG